MKISIHELHQTKPLNKYQRNYLDNMIARTLHEGRGKNKPFRLQVGDHVMDTNTGAKYTVTELYRQNGHNKVASKTRFHREDSLMKV